ncbi:hypothetical protein EXIGLDRAFT_318000 [Exidia glandulosa HHB12029]|uniref:Uncharacterized protein n=1 Tax=Exidia glandulosa HHB12029 TaxID=1314781 RepID=A0A165Q1R6_EXIGL|nr:hypothetical protein EXIGLDRAFT_318000 [Exidia glandulosa HHB12029]
MSSQVAVHRGARLDDLDESSSFKLQVLLESTCAQANDHSPAHPTSPSSSSRYTHAFSETDTFDRQGGDHLRRQIVISLTNWRCYQQRARKLWHIKHFPFSWHVHPANSVSATWSRNVKSPPVTVANARSRRSGGQLGTSSWRPTRPPITDIVPGRRRRRFRAPRTDLTRRSCP